MRIVTALMLGISLLLSGGWDAASGAEFVAAGDCSCACVNHSCCLARSDDGGSGELPALPAAPSSHDVSKLIAGQAAPRWEGLRPADTPAAGFFRRADHRIASSGAALCRMNCTFLI